MSTEPFAHLSSIYRNYDIRGQYPEEITDDEVERIGKALVKHFGATHIAVGRDIRPSSEPLSQALIRGITSQGCHVIDLGLITTPMSYFVCGSTDVDATVMITASHMPAQYNGLKISVDDAKPVTADILQEIRDIVGTHTFSDATTIGSVTAMSPLSTWQAHWRTQHTFPTRPLRVVVDPANMIGGLEIQTLRQFEPELEIIPIYHEFDHTCPYHEANPIKAETLTDLGAAVRIHRADLGIAFDGDADRVGFVDEWGQVVSADIIGALIAEQLLAKQPGATVVYDPRSSRSVPETITAAGGTPVMWKVGHTNIRSKMRELEAVLGIELAGHYFFRDTYYSEGGLLPAFLIMELLHDSDRPLSEHVARVRRYHHSGEINSEISRSPEAIYAELTAAYPDAEPSYLDGLTLSTPEWWCNVRPSANDPVLRLNTEATSEAEMQAVRDALLRIIQS